MKIINLSTFPCYFTSVQRDDLFTNFISQLALLLIREKLNLFILSDQSPVVNYKSPINQNYWIINQNYYMKLLVINY